MSVASFQIDQVRPSGTSYGTADVARNDLWLDRQINLVSLASGSHRYLWSFLDAPAGSSWGPSTPPLNSTMQTANFTPDVLGSYRIQLLVDNSVSEIMVAAVRYDDLGTLQNRGWCYPALGEEVGEDNFHGSTRGWNAILDGIFDDILNFIQGGSAGGVSVQQDGTALPSNPYSTMNFTGAGVSASDVGGIATVNIPGGGGIVAPVVLTGSQSLAIPSVATTYVTDISDGQTSEFHLTGTPADGLSLTFVDSQDTYNWGNNPLVLHPQGGSSMSGLVGVPRVFIQDPVTLTYYSMGMPVTVSVAGASVTWEWSSAESTWYVTSASLGMIGATVSTTTELPLVAGLQAVGVNTLTRIGGRKIDLTPYPDTLGALTRTVYFIVDVDMTPEAGGLTVVLWDRTANVEIASPYSPGCVETVELSIELTVGTDPGDLQSGNYVECQLRMAGGTIGVDQVFCENARILIQYSQEN